jgi:glycosyltransferase involved in cell wall biosynthesis
VTVGAPAVVERLHSDRWAGPAPSIAALVTTYGRASFLPELLDALEAQDLPLHELEVILVDNGSGDDTWEVLSKLVATTELRATALRVDRNHGPAPGRNAGAAEVRAPLLAITDDDCLPTPGWLRHVRLAFRGGADVVQGAVLPDPATVEAMGPWDHTIRVTRPTPFFETCNVAYRRTAFERAGGFDEHDPLLHPPSGRAFGEDACLAWEVQRTGGTAAFARNALVHHRCIPSDYGHWLADQRELAGFPGLARRSPLVASWLHRGVFLDRRSEAFDLAVGGVVAAGLVRRPWPLLLAAPWLRRRVRNARRQARNGPGTLRVLAQLTWSDVVALGAMARGSVRHRRVVL